jgi:hypothetical protein
VSLHLIHMLRRDALKFIVVLEVYVLILFPSQVRKYFLTFQHSKLTYSLQPFQLVEILEVYSVC